MKAITVFVVLGLIGMGLRKWVDPNIGPVWLVSSAVTALLYALDRVESAIRDTYKESDHA